MSRPLDFTARERARRLRLAGHTIPEIVKRVDRPRGTVHDWVFDLPDPTRAKPRQRQVDDSAEAVRLRTEEGQTIQQIAKRLGHSRHTVSRWIAGVPFKVGRLWTDEETAVLERLWTTGAPTSEILAALPGRTAISLQTKASAMSFRRGRNSDRGMTVERPRRQRSASSPRRRAVDDDLETMDHPAILRSPASESNVSSPPAEPPVPWYLRITPRVYVERRREERPKVAARPPDVGAQGGGFSIARRRSS